MLTRRRWLAGCAVGSCTWANRLSSRLSTAGAIGGGLAGALACEKRAASAEPPRSRWPYEVTVGIFRIHADFEITPTSELVKELDKLVSEVGSLLCTPTSTSVMHMVLFEREEEYRRYLDHYFPQLPERRALFLRQRGTAMLFAHRHPELTTDLRHETVHALLNDVAHGEPAFHVPLWLDEGLAEYFEVAKEKRWAGHAHLTEVQQRIATVAPDLEALEAIDTVDRMTGEHYRDAWAWVHFLMHRRPTTRQLLVDQIDTRRRARPILPVSRIVELQMPKWRQEITEHFQAVPTV